MPVLGKVEMPVLSDAEMTPPYFFYSFLKQKKSESIMIRSF